MSEQPEALRLAELCRSGALINDEWDEVAAELLRLHAVELEALELRAKLSQEKEVVAALLAEQDRLQFALNKRHAQVERLQAAGQVLDASEIYKRGWVACAGWAKRPDLIADIDSPAYANERAARLATPQPEPAWSPAYTRGPARQSAPVAAVPALVPLTDEQWLEYLLKYADASILDIAAYHGESIQDRGLWRLRGYANSLRKLVESAHGIGLTVGDGGQG